MSEQRAIDAQAAPELTREEVRRLEVAAMFAELNPARALEEACLEHHRYNVAQQRERNLFKRNGREVQGRAPRRLITINGETRGLVEWCNHFGISHRTVNARIINRWPIEKALTTPARAYARPGIDTKLIEIDGEKRTFAAWARHFGIHYGTALVRVHRGMSLRDALTKPADKKHSSRRRRTFAPPPEENLGTLMVLRDAEGKPMTTREEAPPASPPPAAVGAELEQLELLWQRAQQRAGVKAAVQASLAALPRDDRQAILADLLVEGTLP